MNDEQEVDFLRKIFKLYDKDDLGYLGVAQFTELVATLTKYAPEIKVCDSKLCEAVFAYYDINEDGKLLFSEIYGWWVSPNKFSFFTEENSILMKKARHLYTGYSKKPESEGLRGITFVEFEKMLDNLGVQYDDATFDSIDANDDGLISFVEFVKWLGWF